MSTRRYKILLTGLFCLSGCGAAARLSDAVPPVPAALAEAPPPPPPTGGIWQASAGQFSLAEDRRARLRESLVDHAQRLLCTEGLGAMQARRVAQLAGCSVGAIYNVFPDLDELILRAKPSMRRATASASAIASARPLVKSASIG